ncbi:MAG TPA: mycothiol system anti-sigma-R factor [Actinomycetota bacterium]|nr:mycothiol system anti-sigma-R factor [Actinomycetota bacterium]
MSPIDCEEVLRSLERYLDGELPAGARTEVQEHLGRCGPCMDRAGFRSRLKALLASRCRSEVPAELYARVRALLDEHPPG